MHKLRIALLGKVGWLIAFACLVCLASRSSYVQTVFGQAETQETLVTRLSATEEETRLAAVVDLAALFKSRLNVARPATLAALANTLQNDPAPVVRTHAARALELAGEPSASDALLAALRTERELATHKAILYALARYPAPQVTAALLPLLKHKNVEIRATTAYALAELADTAAATALLEFLQKWRKDDDAFARSQAARGLGRIGYQAAIPALLEALQRDKAQIVRREAAYALGWLSSAQATEVIAALRQAANDDDPYLREAANAAIEQINLRSGQPKQGALLYSGLSVR
jgi:HEAT repeat protein